MSSSVELTPAAADDTDEDYDFYGEIDKLRSLLPIIKCCRIKRYISFNILPSGFKLIADEDSHSLQGSLFLQRALFKTYNLPNGSQSFVINLDEFLIIIESLFPRENIESSRTFTLNVDQMTIVLRNGRLHCSVKNGPQYGKASLVTQELLCPINIFTMMPVNRIVLDASVMVEFWNFVDLSSRYVHVLLDEDQICFGTRSTLGDFDYRIDANSSHIEHFECREPQTRSYDMKLLKCSAPIMKKASKLCIRMDTAGTFNIQVYCSLDPGQSEMDSSSFLNSQPPDRITAPPELTCYVEYFVALSVEE